MESSSLPAVQDMVCGHADPIIIRLREIVRSLRALFAVTKITSEESRHFVVNLINYRSGLTRHNRGRLDCNVNVKVISARFPKQKTPAICQFLMCHDGGINFALNCSQWGLWVYSQSPPRRPVSHERQW